MCWRMKTLSILSRIDWKGYGEKEIGSGNSHKWAVGLMRLIFCETQNVFRSGAPLFWNRCYFCHSILSTSHRFMVDLAFPCGRTKSSIAARLRLLDFRSVSPGFEACFTVPTLGIHCGRMGCGCRMCCFSDLGYFYGTHN